MKIIVVIFSLHCLFCLPRLGFFLSAWCFTASAKWFISDCGGGAGSAVELQEDNAMLKRENRGM
ncbi:hypothetical protein [Candidatus Liberibacter solanacearum]|uniref:hypothetical protein n=1 Tax=Candidatus Liberibacter solanacearum TaxID=556287 RepID=UPI0002D9FBCF|nr:hypothetical protein [Candidatus Liberibacter solanacearum]